MKGHSARALVFWFTGLSGSGKTTLARLVGSRLAEAGWRPLVLDGDDLRPVLSSGLGFGVSDVVENNRRVAEHCASRRGEADALLVPIISPYPEGRAVARAILSPGFFEIYMAADLQTVMRRDPKGLYRRAQAGEIPDMLGFAPDYPYVPPDAPDFTVPSGRDTVPECSENLYGYMERRLTEKEAAAPGPSSRGVPSSG